MTVGKRIRSIRKQQGLTLAEVASKLGMTAAGLSLIELGKRGVSAEQLEFLAAILGVQPSEFFVRNINATSDINPKEVSTNG